MALEAVVSSEGLIFGCWAMAAASGGGGWSWGHGVMEQAMNLEEGNSAAAAWDVGAISSSVLVPEVGQQPAGGSSAAPPPAHHGGNAAAAGAVLAHQEGAAATEEMSSPLPAGRRTKRRRARSVKNSEEVESQRMTHIAVERNRRKQMNEYLAVLRSVMPPSYVQRGDQASIIGGAINYVKELEQLVLALEARKHAGSSNNNNLSSSSDAATIMLFPGFFTFPQYSMSAGAGGGSPAATNTAAVDGNDTAAAGSKPSSVAEIEVTMVESHANLKVLSRRRPRQLLRLVAGLQGHRLTVLHLNVASAGSMAIYSLSLKVEDDCRLSSVDDIAAAVHRIVEAVDREERKDRQDAGELRSSSKETECNSSSL
ncbi:hypothetical protein PR202_ga21298 [Eleusine coracana subsp. coracana]|uniref:BHLH domain-containing protein n=1 Tax=Eleusine coracana subsp. coracana TaxID=191504 RepID=A0AAV5D112_ELECO|nr:hypothetical protein QOZ80_8AG0634730 [Eleusine coracana subsp. coracana]GJN03817.1 hypothetical protein PR202_ga21298 [Eleusine coracana subsp. coracana]